MHVCVPVHVCKLQRHHLWPPFPAQQVAQTHMREACAHISMGVLVGVCLCVFVESGGSIQQHTAAPLMNTLIMLKSAPCLGFPVPPGKVNSGWLHSTARACGRRGGARGVDAAALEERADGVRCLRTKNRCGYAEQISWEHQGATVEATGQTNTAAGATKA